MSLKNYSVLKGRAIDSLNGMGENPHFQIKISNDVSNNGGINILLNDKGLMVDGVSYTKEQASKSGWSIVF